MCVSKRLLRVVKLTIHLTVMTINSVLKNRI